MGSSLISLFQLGIVIFLMCLILFKSLFVVINIHFVLFSCKLVNSDRHLPILWLKIVLKNAFRTNLFNMNHISQNFSMRFFSSGDFCNKYHIFGKNHSSNDKVTVCRSKKRYHWSKTSMICFYHQIPRLSADTWARPPPAVIVMTLWLRPPPLRVSADIWMTPNHVINLKT